MYSDLERWVKPEGCRDHCFLVHCGNIGKFGISRGAMRVMRHWSQTFQFAGNSGICDNIVDMANSRRDSMAAMFQISGEFESEIEHRCHEISLKMYSLGWSKMDALPRIAKYHTAEGPCSA